MNSDSLLMFLYLWIRAGNGHNVERVGSEREVRAAAWRPVDAALTVCISFTFHSPVTLQTAGKQQLNDVYRVFNDVNKAFLFCFAATAALF